MLDKLLLQIASDLCSFCHLGNFLGEITAGWKGNNLYTAVSYRWAQKMKDKNANFYYDLYL